MAVKIISGTHSGLMGSLVDVEVDITKGLPQFNIVGLPDASIKEAKERVRAAIINCGFEFPLGRITINLAPADIKKIGSLLDLPIALGILMESNQIPKRDMAGIMVFGELSLFGEIKGVKGSIPIMIEGINKQIEKFIFPYENIDEIYYLDCGEYFPFKELKQVISYIIYGDMLPYEKDKDKLNKKEDKNNILDFGCIVGQNSSKRALEIAAAGKHNIILYGEPGCGKTMLAKSIISIMPPLTDNELLETAKIYSACGLIKNNSIISRPFRCPHQTITKVSLIGGGKEIKPGEITLAHNGVLFLDEILQFKKDVLEALREPLEEKCINISRISGTYEMPADFLLVGAFNPIERKESLPLDNEQYYCSEEIRKYLKKFSSALLDRIDIFNYVPRIPYNQLNSKDDQSDSKEIRQKVLEAINIQKERFKDTSYRYNSDIRGKDVFEICRLNKECNKILEYYYNNSNVSLRGYTKVIKLARTIADIDNKKDIEEGHILEAISYRKNINGEVI